MSRKPSISERPKRGVRSPPAHLLRSLSLNRIRIDRYEQERALTLDLHLQLIAIVHRGLWSSGSTSHPIGSAIDSKQC